MQLKPQAMQVLEGGDGYPLPLGQVESQVVPLR